MRFICCYALCIVGDLRRTPCKTSLQTEIDEEDSVVQALPAPHNAYGERRYVQCCRSHGKVIFGDLISGSCFIISVLMLGEQYNQFYVKRARGLESKLAVVLLVFWQ